MQSLGRQHNGAFRSRGSRRRHGAGASRYAPWLVLALAVAFGAGLRAEAQQTASWEARRATEDVSLRSGLTGDIQRATVIVNGDELFPVVGIPSFPARWRAREIAARIEALARDPAYDVKRLVAVDHEFGHAVLPAPGQEAVMVITPEDTQLIGIAGAIVADVYKTRIADVIEAYRYERTPAVLVKNALHALARTLGLVAVLFGVFWGFRRLQASLEKRIKRRIEQLEAKSLRIVQAERVWSVLLTALRVLRASIVLVVVYVFLNFVLSLFPWTRHFARTLLRVVSDPVIAMATSVADYIPNLAFLILLFFIVRYVIKILREIFVALGRGRLSIRGFETEWAIPTYRIVRVVVIVFAVVLAYPYIPGSDSQAFKGISILFGVLFSLGSTSLISNVIAGYTMTYRRAFRIGDRVRIGNTLGDVTDMRLLVTHVRTLKNEEVVIPNSTILNSEVVNYSTLVKQRGLILHTTVGIGYETPWRQVEAMLLMAAERTTGISKQPPPFVLQTALRDFAVNYELNAYCGDEKQTTALYSELHRNIQDVFNEYGVQIMTPAYETDTAEPKVVPKAKWYAEPAAPPPSRGDE